jgi:hypothetical protein
MFTWCFFKIFQNIFQGLSTHSMAPYFMLSPLVINPSYYTYIQIFSDSLPYNIMYLPWFATSYNCTFFTLLVWTYHWWFGYPLASIYAHMGMSTIQPTILFGILSKLLFSKVEHTYKDMFPTFPSPHLLESWYCYH